MAFCGPCGNGQHAIEEPTRVAVASMRAIAQTAYGGPEVLQEMTVQKPKPKVGEILVRVYAASINPTDVKVSEGKSVKFGGPDDPTILGTDGAGEVVELGDGCTKFKAGDQVFFAGERTKNMANAEYCVVSEKLCGRKPQNLSWAESAAMPLTTLTAWEALIETMKIPKGGAASILVVGAAGGVGSIATQLAAKVLNLTVIATASRRETVEFCKAQGAHFAISHRKPLLPQLEEINIPKVNYILNCANWGDSQLSEWADCLAPLGQITSILPPNSAIEPATFGKLFFLRAQLNMELMWVRTLKNVEPEKQGVILDAAAELFEDGTLCTTLTKELPFTAAGLREAYEVSNSGTAMGKMCIVDSAASSAGSHHSHTRGGA
jgi:zinc-binding alcohol dehydrogenase family protein